MCMCRLFTVSEKPKRFVYLVLFINRSVCISGSSLPIGDEGGLRSRVTAEFGVIYTRVVESKRAPLSI